MLIMAFSALLLMLNVYVVTNKISVTRRTTGLAAFLLASAHEAKCQHYTWHLEHIQYTRKCRPNENCAVMHRFVVEMQHFA